MAQILQQSRLLTSLAPSSPVESVLVSRPRGFHDMDLSSITREGKGFTVRITDLVHGRPGFLQSTSGIHARFWERGGHVVLTLDTLKNSSTENVCSSETSTERTDVSAEDSGELCSDQSGESETLHTRIGPEYDSFELNTLVARKLGYNALMVQGAARQADKKYVLHFDESSDCEQALDIILGARVGVSREFLNFEHCAFLFNQRIFVNDKKRLTLYKQLIQENPRDFMDKVVLDVGCGLGILSILAAEIGAQEVYAVEPATAATYTEYITGEKGALCIKVFQARVESVELPSNVDTIICDCFGEMLLHGQMLKSLLIAKDRFLKPGGKIYPAAGILTLQPFNVLAYEAVDRGSLIWAQSEPGRGLFSAKLYQEALVERLYHPTLDPNAENRGFATRHDQMLDFAALTPDKLQQIDFPFTCTFLESGFMKGFTFSFRLLFIGSQTHGFLDAENDGEPTRWQNVFCLLPERLHVRARQRVRGNCRLSANEFHSYDIEIKFDTQREHYECKYRLEYTS